MPTTAVIEIYKYHELDDEAQQGAALWLNDGGSVQDRMSETADLISSDWEMLPDNLSVDTWSIGYRADDCELKGHINVTNFLKEQKLANKYRCLYYWTQHLGLEVQIEDNQVTTSDWQVQYEIDPTDLIDPRYLEVTIKLDQQWQQVKGLIENYVVDQAMMVQKALRQEYDWIWSDEYVGDTCASNGYLFHDDGRFYGHGAEYINEVGEYA